MGPLADLVPGGIPGLREGLRRLLGRVFEPPPGIRGPVEDPGDPGLCGPGSASWQLLGEPDSLVGGIRALVLQSMHPAAVAGVADHSRFREDPLGRLRSTAAYVTTSTFGSRRRALTAVARVRHVHATVTGTTPGGRPYRADDPHLLAWVQIALTSSFLAADRLWAPHPLSGGDADRFVAEQSRIAALLDPRVDLGAVRAHLRRGGGLAEVRLPMMGTELPASVAGLVATLERFAAELSVGARAREVIRFLRLPPLSPALRVAYLWLFTGAAGSLSCDQRRRLGLPSGRLAGVAGVANTAGAVALLRGVSGRSAAVRAAQRRVEAGTAA